MFIIDDYVRTVCSWLAFESLQLVKGREQVLRLFGSARWSSIYDFLIILIVLDEIIIPVVHSGTCNLFYIAIGLVPPTLHLSQRCRRWVRDRPRGITHVPLPLGVLHQILDPVPIAVQLLLHLLLPHAELASILVAHHSFEHH